MRTTLDLDQDLLNLAKHLSRESHESMGRVVSNLMRQGLKPAALAAGDIPVLARKPGAKTVTMETVKELLESEA